jgi:molecular chaperone HscB
MIAPFPPGTDYFAAFGLPRKLQIDHAELERRYHDLSRRFHPDFFQSAQPRERRISLENSALVNKAYRTLREPLARADYLVRLEAGPGTVMEPEAPQALFEQILELNELLAEFQMGDPNEQARLLPQLEARQREFQTEYDRLQQRLTGELFPRWDRSIETRDQDEAERKALLADMARTIGHRAYLRRVLSNLEENLSSEP